MLSSHLLLFFLCQISFQRLHCIRDGFCTGCTHGSHIAIAPADANGGDAVGGSAENVILCVANHSHVGITACKAQKVFDDGVLAVPLLFQVCAAHSIEVFFEVAT